MQNRSFVFLFLLFFLSFPACGDDLKNLLRQSAEPLRAEISDLGLPASLVPPETDFLFTLSKQNTGAAAEYDTASGRIFFFREPLQKWLSRNAAKYAPQDLPGAFARCAAPLYAHELSHARDRRFGREHGFAWPVTLEDEYIASVWQLYAVHTLLSKHPDYAETCAEFLPPREWLESAPEEWEQKIFARYAAAPGAALPPPPLTPDHLRALRAGENIVFAGRSFPPRKPRIGLKSFFKRGGYWTALSPRALKQMEKSKFFLIYNPQIHLRRRELP